jgi:D-threo-aldose 1-dehydrogenase
MNTTVSAPQGRTLPATGLRLPALGLGCAALGNLYAAVSDADAAATLEAAWAARLTYFDTAPYYGHGRSEQRLGDWLKAGGGAGATLSTKVGRSLIPLDGRPAPDHGFVDPAPFAPVFDYGRDAVLRQVEHSLARLGRDRIDIAFVHDIGAMTHGEAHPAMFRAALDGALPALAALKAQGVIGAIGIGVNEVAVCLGTLGQVDLDAILLAGRHTLLDQSAAAELLPLCERRGVGVIVGGPFNSGILSGGDHYDYAAAPPAIVERVRRLKAICSGHGVDLAAAALHYPLRHPAVVSVIAGARSPAEVAANAAHMTAPVPAALWAALAAEGLIDEANR